jgi:hypothetical protein
VTRLAAKKMFLLVVVGPVWVGTDRRLRHGFDTLHGKDMKSVSGDLLDPKPNHCYAAARRSPRRVTAVHEESDAKVASEDSATGVACSTPRILPQGSCE